MQALASADSSHVRTGLLAAANRQLGLAGAVQEALRKVRPPLWWQPDLRDAVQQAGQAVGLVSVVLQRSTYATELASLCWV